MLKDRVAIVTGASRGIGRCIAQYLARQGARIVAVSRKQQDTEALVAEIKDQGGDAISVAADVAVEGDVTAMIDAAQEAFGQIDILVNNAGITRDTLLARMKEDDWDAVMNINLKGAFLCTRAAAKVMNKQRYGRIINVTSVVGQMGNIGQANYCASKGGLMGLTRSNARELARRNVTVNAVAPGFIETDMTAELPEKVRTDMAAQIPLGRFGAPEDVAAAVAFLASEQAGYITGHELSVNGGMYM
ncbi:3-oxoacyl-[acyl-carrier-protein] reductase [Desulfuromonas acetoxidans]|uniref:3-oxoacyl-[acyl-carrier-protein] reductase n=1 Tax=Desulfuromonas acetoxidans (strain DSM 684 / 11070) TaxID=281689 RepID=Q1K0L3_DESA6|nr:3-oxoacyl-[acyl-carrier-protein] reductase [Desulfuromonas acetoxidans]EAT15928.1 3-oxoacyl-(acyl-carrier-protein) reductase [Desulfuromonas acetoxidans DSM 684]MBF0644174.1 3-oxoacyl-[acyl-carrier-protein] reductase [Desulfuromonas acetoxidans]NVD24528.1 3-oxoacyl-[acyl-carrier-protein] reductase [Desulfuromonas acetoxidans]NVE16522.1 3-oxoacyl-[acyl-carrier-protein] reductase [Desulfuromonas acetoxidans]